MQIRTFIIAIIALVITLSSCTKDETLFSDMNNKQSQNAIPVGADELLDPMDNVQLFPLEQQAPEISFLDSTSAKSNIVFDTPITFEIEKESALESRGGGLNCGSTISGTTYGKSNKVTTSLYNQFGIAAQLDGGDDIFHFDVISETIVEIELSNTSSNMGMVLFEGGINCSGSNCSYQVNELVAVTSSSSTQGERLYVTLQAGTYILVVDAPYGVASDFTLGMTCLYDLVLQEEYNYGDNFNSYNNGNISWQSNTWSKWNANYSDGQVVGEYNKFLYMTRNTYGSQPSAIYDLAQHDNGIYHVDFQIWVASNRSAYFNVQKQLTYGNSNNEFGIEVYFYNNRTGAVKIAGRTYPFRYNQNQWIDVTLDVHLNESEAWVMIGNEGIQFNPRWSNGTNYGSLKMDAVSFYPAQSDARFWIDNIRVDNTH